MFFLLNIKTGQVKYRPDKKLVKKPQKKLSYTQPLNLQASATLATPTTMAPKRG